jgi:hypothetical protein
MNVNTVSPPNCSYEFYTIHTDSLNSNSWTDGTTQSKYTNYLFRPLKNIVQVSIQQLSVPTGNTMSGINSNVFYLCSEQLISSFNENTGEPTIYSDASSITSTPNTNKDKVRTALGRFMTISDSFVGTVRTEYRQNDFSTQTQFIHPITRLDRITTELLDERGDALTLQNSNVFVSYRFTCLRDNLCPK